ncbi:MAG: MMPL family transporter [Varibaculum cambriense]|uniref:MMPL family transporter n=1 Tax=Varibaculum cambriense TaxID=184870 RepID=UPI002915A82E|nr:MMPL family transporter [Varibaculum cambriense]MDU6680843.1 MMPL family transporter [Varibaculum cambriense]
MKRMKHFWWGKHPGFIVTIWLLTVTLAIVAVFSGLGGKPLFERLITPQPASPASESTMGKKLYEQAHGDTYPVTAVVEIPDLEKHADQIAKMLRPVHADLLQVSKVKQIADPFIAFDPQLPAGKKAQEQIDQALMQALAQGKTQAEHVARAKGASGQQLEKAKQRAEREVKKAFSSQLPPAWKTIQSSELQQLIAEDGKTFLINVQLTASGYDQVDPDARDQVARILEEIPDYFSGSNVTATVNVVDNIGLQNAANGQVKADMLRGEGISIPISLLIMTIVFGGMLAALLPLMGAGAAIGITLMLILALTYLITVESFVVNIVSFLGLGLSIDYGLLIVSRYRHELHKRGIHGQEDTLIFYPRFLQLLVASRREGDRKIGVATRKVYRTQLLRARKPYLEALDKTMDTAGATVFFSALIVSLAILGLCIFPLPLLRLMGIGGVLVTMLAMISNMTFLPALMMLFGPSLASPSRFSHWMNWIRRHLLRRSRERSEDDPSPVFRAVSTFVTRRPWPVLVVVTLVLVVMSLPLYQMQMRSSAVESMPRSIPQIGALWDMWERFPDSTNPQIRLVAKTTPQKLQTWAEEKVEPLSHVKRIRPAEDLKIDGQQYAALDVYTKEKDAFAAQVKQEMQEVRQLPAPFKIWVTGEAALQTDFQDTLYEYASYVFAVVAITTYLMLFLMTGALLLPLQALILNMVSLMSSLGVAVWVFQYGHGEKLLGFTSLGAVESYVVAIVFCFGFGLSMDYEMFLVSRVKEIWDETADNKRAVRDGLTHSASTITSAALILLVVFLGFTTGGIQAIKQIGFTLAVAVALDATLVRMGLVPAIMAICGKANWWAPKWLRSFHSRLPLPGH